MEIPEKSEGSTLTLKAQMKIFPSSRVTRIHTMGANSALWIMAENRYLQEDAHVYSSVKMSRQERNKFSS